MKPTVLNISGNL